MYIGTNVQPDPDDLHLVVVEPGLVSLRAGGPGSTVSFLSGNPDVFARIAALAGEAVLHLAAAGKPTGEARATLRAARDKADAMLDATGVE